MEAPRYCTVATTSRSWWRRRCRRMCSMIGRPATGTSGFGCRLVSGRRRDPSPPAITTAFIVPSSLPSYSAVEDLKQKALDPRVADVKKLALDLVWTWQPRIQDLFKLLGGERWEQTRQNPVLILKELGDDGVAALLDRPEVAKALDEARST